VQFTGPREKRGKAQILYSNLGEKKKKKKTGLTPRKPRQPGGFGRERKERTWQKKGRETTESHKGKKERESNLLGERKSQRGVLWKQQDLPQNPTEIKRTCG